MPADLFHYEEERTVFSGSVWTPLDTGSTGDLPNSEASSHRSVNVGPVDLQLQVQVPAPPNMQRHSERLTGPEGTQVLSSRLGLPVTRAGPGQGPPHRLVGPAAVEPLSASWSPQGASIYGYLGPSEGERAKVRLLVEQPVRT